MLEARSAYYYNRGKYAIKQCIIEQLNKERCDAAAGAVQILRRYGLSPLQSF